jgi:protein-arginine kinase activator protein McsA
MYFEKRMWYKPLGVIIKTLVSDEPLGPIKKKREIPLQEQLEIAVESENYELAAELRDKIKKAIAKEKRNAKKLNNAK